MLDLVIILLFIIYAIWSGFSSKKEASKDLKEYFLAGRNISGWKAGFSMAATQFAADTPLLVTGLIATGGVFLLWRLWIYGISFILIGFIFATKWRRANVITDAELTEIRYSGKGITFLRTLKAVYYGTVINCIVLAMVLVAAMRISEVFLPWHEWLSPGVYNPILGFIKANGLNLVESITGIDNYIATTNNLLSIFIVVSFTTLYSSSGGLRSVIATDVAQFMLAMIGTLVYGWILVDKVGGLSALSTKVNEIYSQTSLLDFSPPSELTFSFLTLVGIQWLFQMNSDGTGYLAQRSMACKTDRDARIAAIIFSFAQVVIRSIIWLIIGASLLVLYPFTPTDAAAEGFTASREVLFITGIKDFLPTGVLGLMLVGMLGALSSTIDTHLNWGASYWSNDIYQNLINKIWLKREASNKELVWVARLSNILILVIALIIMFNLGSISHAWSLSLLFGAGMGSVLIMRWMWERINLFSELAAIVTSLIVAPLLLQYVSEEWLQIVYMALFTTASAIIVTFFTPATSPEKLKSFYQTVQPQGLWRNTAKLVNDDPNLPLAKLKTSLGEIGLICLTMFGLLIGIGKMLLLQPHESIIWYILLTLASLAIVPIWWKKV
jgi:SSS family solute:Na+ symporter